MDRKPDIHGLIGLTSREAERILGEEGPNELPVVLTIFLALGAWRLSRTNVLARSAPVVETLGSATVLCVDKTGTLTLNRMTVTALHSDGILCNIGEFRSDPPPDTFHDLVEFSILASQLDPFDPMERAIKEFGEAYLAHTEHLHGDWRLEKEYPLSPELLAMSHVCRAPEGMDYVIAAKGAPEAVADLCHFSDSQQEEMMSTVTRMADDGLRVLGVARSYFREAGLPSQQHDFTFEFLGLVGLADPVRPTVAPALQDCYRAGIRMVMITGDYPGTARSIARQIGLARGQGELEARTLAFTTLIIANLGLMMTNRSWTSTIGNIHQASNAALWWVTGGAVVFLGLVLNIPFLREIFRFSLIHPVDVVICVSAGVLSVVWFELFKLFSRKRG